MARYELKDRSVLVLGLGRSGVAAARFLASEGSRVTVCDSKAADDLAASLDALDGIDVELALGSLDALEAADKDLVVVSPGVPLSLPGLVKARERGVPIVGEMELAASRIQKPIIAVTGTNGKTTTASLIGHMLRSAGMRCPVAGNIGAPAISMIVEANEADRVVLEVSSFQLEAAPSLAADIAVWLNATDDHLDRHGTFENYVASKSKLFEQMASSGFGIYNAACDAVSDSVAVSVCNLAPFDATGKVLSSPGGARANRAWYEDGVMWVQVDGVTPHRFPIDGLKLAGAHNIENMLAALLAVRLSGVEWESMEDGLRSFEGLPHRVELVCEVDGVRYYDDSKGTNVGATVKAMEGFSEQLILIAGGQAKGADFAGLARAAEGRLKHAVLIGESAPAIQTILEGIARTSRAQSMEEAVRMASREASPGDVVLLSPACASFDMFKDYADRGESFARAAKGLLDA